MTPQKAPLDPPPEADNPEQSRRFIDMAREVQVDESPGAFDRAFEKIVKPTPQRKPEKKTSSSGQ
jgi:hypothetical protein